MHGFAMEVSRLKRNRNDSQNMLQGMPEILRTSITWVGLYFLYLPYSSIQARFNWMKLMLLVTYVTYKQFPRWRLETILFIRLQNFEIQERYAYENS